jgi:hypothetical protein
MSRWFAGFAVAIALATIAPEGAHAKSKRPQPPSAAPETDDKPPVITHQRITRAPIGEAVTVRAKMEDESEIFAPALYARPEGQAEFESFGMKHIGDVWEATIPAAMTQGNVEYFIEAFDDQGNGPSRDGSPESPIKIVVFDPAKEPKLAKPLPPPPKVHVVTQTTPPEATKVVTNPPGREEEDTRIATKWWFWTIVGVAVTAGVAVSIVLLQSGGGKTDTVDVMVRGPDPAAKL